MTKSGLHIIAFDIPYPADYGGVIDIFYKLKSLHSLNIDIHLHCFKYGRDETQELNKYCKSVTYYDRKLNILSLFSKKPFIVKTRKNKNLLENLCKDNFPILFEGLHTTYFISDERLKFRKKIVRMHNIEHDYYLNLFKQENNLLNKLYFGLESLKLKFYEKILEKSDLILSISEKDDEYFEEKYQKSILIPAFHEYSELRSKFGKGKYIVYHGNLSVKENEEAAIFLINTVFSKLAVPVKIAGKKPSQKLEKAIKNVKNIELISDLSYEQMSELIKNSQISVLYTFQTTGLKLKLLSSLYEGRFCICNDKMLFGTKLDKICIVANLSESIILQINKYFHEEFNVIQKQERQFVLEQNYSNKANAKKIIDALNKILQ